MLYTLDSQSFQHQPTYIQTLPTMWYMYFFWGGAPNYLYKYNLPIVDLQKGKTSYIITRSYIPFYSPIDLYFRIGLTYTGLQI